MSESVPPVSPINKHSSFFRQSRDGMAANATSPQKLSIMSTPGQGRTNMKQSPRKGINKLPIDFSTVYGSDSKTRFSTNNPKQP